MSAGAIGTIGFGIAGMYLGQALTNKKIGSYTLVHQGTSKLTLFFITIIPPLIQTTTGSGFLACVSIAAIWYVTQVPLLTCLALPLITAIGILLCFYVGTFILVLTLGR